MSNPRDTAAVDPFADCERSASEIIAALGTEAWDDLASLTGRIAAHTGPFGGTGRA